jgi:hypothetical protein
MDKLAVFVEGQTEQIFVESLIHEIAGRHRVHIDAVQAFGGRNSPRHFLEVHATKPEPHKEYYVLIYDCMGDSKVLSDVREQYAGLASQGYLGIVGVRDVLPQAPADIPTIRSDFESFLPASPIRPLLVLAVMEIEAWFIAEHTHFGRLHPSLTAAAVSAKLGYEPASHDVQTIACPTDDLRSVYSLAGLGYAKKRNQVERTVRQLDYAELYLTLPSRIPDLGALVSCVDRFLS